MKVDYFHEFWQVGVISDAQKLQNDFKVSSFLFYKTQKTVFKLNIHKLFLPYPVLKFFTSWLFYNESWLLSWVLTSRRHIWRSKIAKWFQSVKFSLLQNPKVGQNCSAGDPLARIPGALKGGNVSDFSTSLSQSIEKMKGYPLNSLKIFQKKSHNAEKNWKGTLWDFPTSILSQTIKKIEGDPSKQKPHSAEKN